MYKVETKGGGISIVVATREEAEIEAKRWRRNGIDVSIRHIN